MNNEEFNQVPVQPVTPVTPVVPNPEPQVIPTTPAPVSAKVEPPVVPTEPVAPRPIPQTQINPTAVMPDATEIPTVEANAPVAPRAEAPIIEPAQPVQTTPVQGTISPVVEPKEDTSDVANTTFDYNALYGIQKSEEEIAKDEQLDVVDKPMFSAQEIVIESPTITNRTSEDVVPEFNINALDENANTTTKTTDSSMNDNEKDKAETRRAIAWILVIALLLIVFVGFIFPIMAK